MSIAVLMGVAATLVSAPAAPAQSGGPFGDDSQPIVDEYGLPPDGDSGSGAGAGGVSTGGGGGGVDGSGAADGSPGVTAQGDGGGSDGAGAGQDGELQVSGGAGGDAQPLGIGESASVPVGGADDPRQGLDIVVLAFAGLAALALVVLVAVRLVQRRRPS